MKKEVDDDKQLYKYHLGEDNYKEENDIVRTLYRLTIIVQKKEKHDIRINIWSGSSIIDELYGCFNFFAIAKEDLL